MVSTARLAEKIASALGRNSRSFYFPTGLLRAAATLLGRSGTDGQIVRFVARERAKDTPRIGMGSPVFDGAGFARHGGLVSQAAQRI